ncbi:MAG: lipase family protein [Caldilineaceae bacterium]
MDYAKALKCATLAQEIYYDFAAIKFSEFVNSRPELIQNDATDTQCAILPGKAPDATYIVFRGTEKNADWKTNVEFTRALFEIRWTEVSEMTPPPDDDKPRPRQILPAQPDGGQTDLAPGAPRAKMHQGFVNAYMSVQDYIHRYLRNNEVTNLTITGHSLGGALATLCAIDLQLTYAGQYAMDIYTFGAPKVGNPEFRDLFTQHIPRSYRFHNALDIVPDLPRPWQGYRHVNTEYRLGSRLSWQFFSRRVSDHYMKSYIAALRAAANL